jgi:hypothetical protein
MIEATIRFHAAQRPTAGRGKLATSVALRGRRRDRRRTLQRGWPSGTLPSSLAEQRTRRPTAVSDGQAGGCAPAAP